MFQPTYSCDISPNFSPEQISSGLIWNGNMWNYKKLPPYSKLLNWCELLTSAMISNFYNLIYRIKPQENTFEHGGS